MERPLGPRWSEAPPGPPTSPKEQSMVLNQAAGPQMGIIYSRLMIAIALLTAIALIWVPQSRDPEAFQGRTPSSTSFSD
jgi:hypothetical protein